MTTAAGRGHYEEAERLLERAAEMETGPRCHHSKTLATMALAHATLAQSAAVAKAADTLDRIERNKTPVPAQFANTSPF